ncbi:MAG: amidohydrolase family protein [Lachnospiraceae bacterium]|nr:amidohydrolase family protein [Lachnospiraceae bacterium]
MIIDFHTHTFPDKIAAKAIDKLSHEAHIVPFRDGTVNSLITTAKAAGVDLSVILPVATSPEQVSHINDSAHMINTKESSLLSFACIHPDIEDYKKELHRIKELGFKGIKLHPVYQKTDIDDVKFLRIINLAAELDLIVITHAGLDVGFPGETQSSPEKCKHVVDEIGNFKFVLAHMGGWRNWDRVLSLLADSGVWIDTAFSCGKMHPLTDGYWSESDLDLLSPDKFMDMVKAFGPDKVLFGTDSPWSDQKESLDFIRNLPLSDDDKNLILGENARTLLK